MTHFPSHQEGAAAPAYGHTVGDHRHTSRTLALALTAVIFAATVGTAHAGSRTLHVGMIGIDSPDCGGRKSPCRTISQAVANASAGATIVVGPGRYGDLDGDGVLRAGPEDLGEEDPVLCAAASCAIRITKGVTVVSSDGPGATVLDGGHELLTTMLITANGATLGRPKQGFTIVGSRASGVLVRGDDFRVGGNLFTANDADGLTLDVGDRTTVHGNTIVGNGRLGIFVKPEADDAHITGNHIAANGRYSDGAGIETHADPLIRGNVVNANLGPGIIVVDGSAAIVGNDVSGNEHWGIIVSGGATAAIRENAILANASAGVYLAGGAAATINRNDIYANDPLSQNCGTRNGSGAALDATDNYWGHPDGPDLNPADLACDTATGSTTNTARARTKSIKLRLKVGR